MKVLAIDFETAGYARDTACAIGLAMLEDGRIKSEMYELICPPCEDINFTEIHGLTWADLADKPSFAVIWRRIETLMAAADVWAAHNVGFDRQVLTACAARHDITLPRKPWLCTVQLSRAIWPLASHRLSDVYSHLKIDLDHHHAMSDDRACASIVLHSQRADRDLTPFLRHH